MTTADRIDRALVVARGLMTDEAPGLLTLTHIAEYVAADASVTTNTARNWLRTACETGELYEVVPDYNWGTDLPGARQAGIRDLCITKVWAPAKNNRHIITITRERKSGEHRPGTYGPGKTTYLLDRSVAENMVEEMAAKEQAELDAQAAEYKARKKAERDEITRRARGLQPLMRRIGFLTNAPRDNGTKVAGSRAHARLGHGLHADDTPLADLPLELDVSVWGTEPVATLWTILQTGVEKYIDDQPFTACAHCSEQILPTPRYDIIVWWHVGNAAHRCPGGRDTVAEPVKEAGTP